LATKEGEDKKRSFGDVWIDFLLKEVEKDALHKSGVIEIVKEESNVAGIEELKRKEES